MVGLDPLATQRDTISGIVAELGAAGFEDVDEIGRGGFGIVFRCLQRALDRTVAVKVLTADLDPENVERFLREQRAMGRLYGHPHIVNILQVGATASGRPHIVMQYHRDGSLEMRIRRHGPLGWVDATRIGVKLAGALETAHRLGILHRDIKPGNVLLTEYGEPQLTDFGIARIAGGFETSSGTITGSPAFTAPEILEGRDPTPASDVYGLGATLFCAVTGHAAFERRSGEEVVAQFLRISRQPVPDLRGHGIPDEVSGAIERAMARNPGDRFATAAEFGIELRNVQSTLGVAVDEMVVPGDRSAVHDGERPRAAVGLAHPPGSSRFTGPTPPAPATRFRPPTPTPTRSMVARARLIDTLRAGQRRRLTVIHAPAGFGKSTLAAQWRKVLNEEGVGVAWLSVDRDDNTVVWFLAHLIEAIGRVRPALAAELGRILQEHGDEAERYVLSSLIDEVHDRDDRVAVVVDDWHRVTGAESIAAMGYLLDNGCHHLQIIVTSRTRSGLPLSRMRVRDELVEIDSTALRFDNSEARSLLVDVEGLPLGTDDVSQLRESTDGWAAALQLASLSLRGRENPAKFIGHLSGRHHAIGEFLAENVLDTLESDMLDFLLATSITERICGSLASALTRVDRGQALLEAVEERDLFLRRADDDSEWFRYHPLFAEFLQRRLERDHPGRISELHRTAARWFAEHHLPREAVDHALAAGDQQWAVDVVEAHGMDLIENSQMASLLALTAKLPPLLATSSPRLQLSVAWANVLLQRQVPAHAALDLVRSSLDRSTLPDTVVTNLRVEAAVANALAALAADRTADLDELEECFSRPDTLRAFVVSTAANVATLVEIDRFNFAAARRRQEWATPYHQQSGGPFTAIYGHCFAGIAANEQLDVTAAEHEFREALRVAQETRGAKSHMARIAGSLLGKLLYERGELTEAERLLDDSYELQAEGGTVEFMIARYVTGARIKALRGDRESAAQHLSEGQRIASALSLPQLRAWIEHERIRLGNAHSARPGDRRRISDTRDTPPGLDTPEPDGVAQIVYEVQEATAIRVLLAEQTREQADLACARAAALVDRISSRERPRALLHAHLLLSVCLIAAGRIADAKNVLAPAAATCAELGLTRVLLDVGPQILTGIMALHEDLRGSRWQPEWPDIPESFLTQLTT